MSDFDRIKQFYARVSFFKTDKKVVIYDNIFLSSSLSSKKIDTWYLCYYYIIERQLIMCVNQSLPACRPRLAHREFSSCTSRGCVSPFPDLSDGIDIS